MFNRLLTAFVIGLLALGAMAQEDSPELASQTLPVKKDTFHRFDHLREGALKTSTGWWRAEDWALAIYNPNPKRAVKVTWKLISDDPNFVYSDGSKGIWVKEFTLLPDTGATAALYGDPKNPDRPIPVGSHWTGSAEFSGPDPFYVYIQSMGPRVQGRTLSSAMIKTCLLWSGEVPGPWDREVKGFVFPYTNYFHNHPFFLGGWHSRIILENGSDKQVSYNLYHRPYFGKRWRDPDQQIGVWFMRDLAEVNLKPGQKMDLYLEDLYGWQKDFSSVMEGRLIVTPNPPEAYAQTRVRLFVVPNTVTMDSLKEKEKEALSEEAGIVLPVGAEK